MARFTLSSLMVALVCLSGASGYGNGSPSCDVKVPRHGGRPLGRPEADNAGYNINKEQQVNGWKVTILGPPMKGLLINTNSPGRWVDLDGSLFKSMKIGGNCITQRQELPGEAGSSGGQDSHEDDAEDGDSSEEGDDSSEEGDDSSEEDDNDNGNSAFSFWFRRRNSNNQRSQKISSNGTSSYTFTYKTEGAAQPRFDVIIVETYRKYYTGILV